MKRDLQGTVSPKSKKTSQYMKYDNDISSGTKSEVEDLLPDPLYQYSKRNFQKYYPIQYISNYYSVQSSLKRANGLEKNIHIRNEILLKKYYLSKPYSHNIALNNSLTSKRQGSVTSTSEISTIGNDRITLLKYVDKFLDTNNEYNFDEYMLGNRIPEGELDQNYKRIDDIIPGILHQYDIDISNILYSACTKSYLHYLNELQMVNYGNDKCLKKHDLWMPAVRGCLKTLVRYEKDEDDFDTLYEPKTSPLFITRIRHTPEHTDPLGGVSIIPSVFSEFKFPMLTYHCGISLGDDIIIFGGLMATYMYDDEAPNLNDFEVDGIHNLPSPLLPEVINNPSLINNPHLYILSSISKRLRRPELSGQIPPSLCCAQASKINDRYIFIYGGFELKTEAKVTDIGKYRLTKSIFINNLGYILDTITFKFSKIEILADYSNQELFNMIPARFGHLQMAVNIRSSPTNSHTPNLSRRTTTDNVLDKSQNIQNNTDGSSNVQNETLHNNFPSTANSNPTNTTNTSICTLYIFGGYTHNANDAFEALDDCWKIELSTLSRGKGGHLKFPSTTAAISIKKPEHSKNWPPARGFSACAIPEMHIPEEFSFRDFELSLLENLKNNFEIDKVHDDKAAMRPNLRGMSGIDSTSLASADIIDRNKESRDDLFANDRYSSTPISLYSERSGRHGKHQNVNEVIIMHGGSDNSKVYGDLWYFNITSETWSSKQISFKSSSDSYEFVPVEIPLVGHELVFVGISAVFFGGFTQRDVVTLFAKDRDRTKLIPDMDDDRESRLMNGFNMSTLKVQSQVVKRRSPDSSDYILDEEKSPSVSTGLSVGFILVDLNGSYSVIGGVISHRININRFYMRGALLCVTLPSISMLT